MTRPIFVLLFAVCASAPLQDTPQHQRPENPNRRQGDSTSRKNQPTTLTIAATSITDSLNKTADNNKATAEEHTTPTNGKSFWDVTVTDVAIAIFAFCGVVVAIFQWGALKATVGVTATAANAARDGAIAAKAAADALPLIERAYVFVKVDWNEGVLAPLPTPPDLRITYGVRFDLANHGKTPAVLSRWQENVEVRAAEPSLADVAALEWKTPARPVVGGTSNEMELDALMMSYRQWQQLGKTLDIFAYGTLEYRDVLNKDRTTGFCWKLDVVSYGFEPTANGTLNYYR